MLCRTFDQTVENFQLVLFWRLCGSYATAYCFCSSLEALKRSTIDELESLGILKGHSILLIRALDQYQRVSYLDNDADDQHQVSGRRRWARGFTRPPVFSSVVLNACRRISLGFSLASSAALPCNIFAFSTTLWVFLNPSISSGLVPCELINYRQK